MKNETFELAGKTITLEHGEVAWRAGGAVVLRCGDAMLLATVTVARGVTAARDDEDDEFVPLTVEYREKMAALAKIPGGYGKRELRLSDHEVLVSRLVDRAIRPLFPEGFAHETQVLVTVYGAEPDSDLEVLAVIAASAALAVSEVPWRGPVGAARVVSGGLELLAAAHADGLVMLEGQAGEVGELVLAEAIGKAQAEVQPALLAIGRLAEGGKAKAAFEAKARPTIVRQGRGDGEVREVAAKVGYLPSNDGSALFSRGRTQALVSVTIGQPDEAPIAETVFGKKAERFFLHYNFPSFSVGEVKQNRGPGRREIGHGALARRALVAVLPDELPYAVRVVSDILTSDGSSSMATVCGASLALMDAGVPMKGAVAGVAVGLTRSAGTRLLVDITGEEDASGDMDFKVAGTRNGLTAVQLDVKGEPVPVGTLVEAIGLARPALDTILAAMDGVLAAARPEMKRGSPQVINMKVAERRIGALIGPGGKTINEIQSATGTKIDVKDDGRVRIVGKRLADVKAAEQRILGLTIELRVGEIYDAEVVTLKEYGVFVRIADHEGLVHISELGEQRVEKVEDVVKLGDAMRVKVLGADEKGRLKLSKRAVG